MIASLNGILIAREVNSCVVECGGVGYLCQITSNTLGRLPEMGKPVFLYTYMAVRDDGLDLFGFAESEEMECFKKITSVSGVGPKIGLAILSALTADQVAHAIAANDYKRLTAANGVGQKLAQRIVLELRDKFNVLSTSFDNGTSGVSHPSGTHTGSAIDALVVLGYSQSEASLAVGRLDPTLPEDILIKEALKNLMRGV